MEVEKGKERVGNWEMELENQQIDCELPINVLMLMLILIITFHFICEITIFLLISKDAANDVHSSMAVYQKLCNIAQLNSIILTDNQAAFTSHVELPSSSELVTLSSSSEIVTLPSSSETVTLPSSSSDVIEKPSLEIHQ